MSDVARASAFFGARSVGVLYSACYRAEANRSRVVGTEHLLCAILLRGGWDRSMWSQLRRALRDRDRSAPPVGARGQVATSAPSSALDLEVDGTLREAAVLRSRRRPAAAPGLAWQADVRSALAWAVTAAAESGITHLGPRYLLDAVLVDHQSGAHELLEYCHVDRSRLLAAVDRGGGTPWRDDPRKTIVGALEAIGVLDPSTPPSTDDANFDGLRRMAYRLARLALRLNRADRMQVALEMEAVRQAVRLGSQRVDTGHLLLATLELDRNLDALGTVPPAQLAAVNAGGAVLAGHRVTYHRAALVAAQPDLPREAVATRDSRAAGLERRQWRRRSRPGRPRWTVLAHEAADAALAEAASRGTRAGSGYLLKAALAAPEGSASQILGRLGRDPVAIAEEVGRGLGPD